MKGNRLLSHRWHMWHKRNDIFDNFWCDYCRTLQGCCCIVRCLKWERIIWHGVGSILVHKLRKSPDPGMIDILWDMEHIQRCTSLQSSLWGNPLVCISVGNSKILSCIVHIVYPLVQRRYHSRDGMFDMSWHEYPCIDLGDRQTHKICYLS